MKFGHCNISDRLVVIANKSQTSFKSNRIFPVCLERVITVLFQPLTNIFRNKSGLLIEGGVVHNTDL